MVVASDVAVVPAEPLVDAILEALSAHACHDITAAVAILIGRIARHHRYCYARRRASTRGISARAKCSWILRVRLSSSVERGAFLCQGFRCSKTAPSTNAPASALPIISVLSARAFM